MILSFSLSQFSTRRHNRSDTLRIRLMNNTKIKHFERSKNTDSFFFYPNKSLIVFIDIDEQDHSTLLNRPHKMFYYRGALKTILLRSLALYTPLKVSN